MNRIPSLDRFKGMLVLLMIVYHGTFVLDVGDASDDGKLIREHLTFLHSAFVFATGFLCGYYYYPKWLEGSRVAMRLVSRGLRLLGVFVVSNIAAYLVLEKYESEAFFQAIRTWPSFLENFILGVSGELFAFEILAYIAVYLCLASLAISPRAIAGIGLFLYFLYLRYESSMAEFLLVGIVGQAIGIVTQSSVRLSFQSISRSLRWGTGIACVVVYILLRYTGMLLLDSWHRPFLLAFDAMTCWAISGVSFAFLSRWVDRIVVLLGKHTLVAYLAQMPLILAMSILFLKINASARLQYGLLCVLVTAFLFIGLRLLDRARGRWKLFDTAYRNVFA